MLFRSIAKRVLIHTAGFNLGLLMRVKFGLLKPRRLSDRGGCAPMVPWLAWKWLLDILGRLNNPTRVMSTPFDQLNGSFDLRAA